MMQINRGDIFYADMIGAIGSEQSGLRPCVIISNNIGNTHSPCVIVALVTSKLDKPNLPTHVMLPADYGLSAKSVILCEQIRTIDKRRLKTFLGSLPNNKIIEIDLALKVSLNL